MATVLTDKALLEDLAGRIGAAEFSVWARVGLGIGESIRTAARESRHFMQLICRWPSQGDTRAIEIDDERYVRDFWARHGSRLLARTAELDEILAASRGASLYRPPSGEMLCHGIDTRFLSGGRVDYHA